MEKLEIHWFGQTLSLRSTETDPKVLEEILMLAKSKLDEVKSRTCRASPQTGTLIAFLELAEQYVQAKQKVIQYQKEISKKVDEIAKTLSSEC